MEQLPKYIQLEFFPPTTEDVLFARMKDCEKALDRQRKAQFAKIGTIQRQCDELFGRLEAIERGLCRPEENKCEMLEYLA